MAALSIFPLQTCLEKYVVPGLYYVDPFTPADLDTPIPFNSPLLSRKWNQDYLTRAAAQGLRATHHKEAPQEEQSLLTRQQIQILAGERLKIQTAAGLDLDYHAVELFTGRNHKTAFNKACDHFPGSPFEGSFDSFYGKLKDIHSFLIAHDPDNFPGKIRSMSIIIHSRQDTLWNSGSFNRYILTQGLKEKFGQFLFQCETYGDFETRIQTTDLFSDPVKQVIKEVISDVISSKGLEDKLREYFEEVQKIVSVSDIDPFTKLETVHQGFVKVHPFADGNGRMARLLMNLTAVHLGIPPLFFPYQKPYAEAVHAGMTKPGSFADFLRQRSEELAKENEAAKTLQIDPEIYSELLPLLQKCSRITIPKESLYN
jgi:hypothetical protein